MFKLPNSLPTKTSDVEELVDFVEWECIRQKDVSIQTVLKPIFYTSDELKIMGVEDDTDVIINRLDDISVEIDRRRIATNGRYPFSNDKNGYRLSIKKYDHYCWVYIYLLLSTRLNMLTNKVFRNIDGTGILEELSAIVAKSYFGDRADSKVFGTAEEGSFAQKVNEMCSAIGEGHSFLNRDSSTPSAKDDKLDVVVWKNFNDKSRSKLLGFGQCKTGTSWDDASTIELQPLDFCSKWLRDVPVSIPVKLFFSSQYFPLDNYSKSKNAGIVFDRFRILDYLPEEFDQDMLTKITLWCKAAIISVK